MKPRIVLPVIAVLLIFGAGGHAICFDIDMNVVGVEKID